MLAAEDAAGAVDLHEWELTMYEQFGHRHGAAEALKDSAGAQMALGDRPGAVQ